MERPVPQPPPFPPGQTALLLVDALNEFLKPGGKLYERTKATAQAADTVANLERVTAAARGAGILVVYANHHSNRGGDYDGWKHPTPSHRRIAEFGLFAAGSFGARVIDEVAPQPGDVIAQEHWTSSGFANTDLKYLLNQRGIERVVVAGNRANTCIDSTGRYAVELGFHATLISDAIAAFSEAEMEATINVNWPAFAHAVVTSDEFIAAVAGGCGNT
ncbi:MAG: cysteine hydrolase [Chloroflexota bacterium]|nr:cysteine hydrolase [Chloroflexota bacterium]